MDKKPFLEADSVSADQIPLILCRQRFNYRVPKSRPLFAGGSRPHTVVVLFPCDRSVLFPTTTPYACLISPIFHMPVPSHTASFDHPNTSIWRAVNTVTLIRSFFIVFLSFVVGPNPYRMNPFFPFLCMWKTDNKHSYYSIHFGLFTMDGSRHSPNFICSEIRRETNRVLECVCVHLQIFTFCLPLQLCVLNIFYRNSF